MPEIKYDWVKLKDEWFLSEEINLSKFLETAIGQRPDSNGNVNEHTKGWIEEKKEYKRREAEKIKAQLDKELIEKLKIKLEDLLLNKKLLYSLDSKYLELYGKIINHDPNDKKPALTQSERNFFNSYESDILTNIFQRIQIELGLPVHVEKLKGDKDEPITILEIVRRAEKARRTKENADRGTLPTIS